MPNSDPMDYKGLRKLDALHQNALQLVSEPFFTPIHSKEILDLKKSKEVLFFLVFNPYFYPQSYI
jgi:hypothetical protein